MAKDNWPKNKDGSPKKMGDLTKEQQRSVVRASLKRIKAEVESPAFRKVLEDFKG